MWKRAGLKPENCLISQQCTVLRNLFDPCDGNNENTDSVIIIFYGSS